MSRPGWRDDDDEGEEEVAAASVPPPPPGDGLGKTSGSTVESLVSVLAEDRWPTNEEGEELFLSSSSLTSDARIEGAFSFAPAICEAQARY